MFTELVQLLPVGSQQAAASPAAMHSYRITTQRRSQHHTDQ
jgi:hypothetical protein